MNLLSVIILVLLVAAMTRGYTLGFNLNIDSLGGRFIVYAVANHM